MHLQGSIFHIFYHLLKKASANFFLLAEINCHLLIFFYMQLNNFFSIKTIKIQQSLLFVWPLSLSESFAVFHLFTKKIDRHDHIARLFAWLPGSVKCFITVEIILVSIIIMILTLEKETKQSLGAPRVACTSHTIMELSGIRWGLLIDWIISTL